MLYVIREYCCVRFESQLSCCCLWFLTDRNKTVKQCPCSLQPVKLSVVSSDATGQKALCCWQFMGFSLSVERTVRLDNRALNGKARCYYATEQPNNICQVKRLAPLQFIRKFVRLCADDALEQTKISGVSARVHHASHARNFLQYIIDCTDVRREITRISFKDTRVHI